MEADVLRFGEDVVEGVAHFWMNDVVSLVDVMVRTGGSGYHGKEYISDDV